MIKKTSFVMLLLLVLVFSLGAIQASDVNATDDAALNSSDDASLQVDDVDPVEETSDELELSDDNASIEKDQTKITSPTSNVYYGGSFQVTLIDSNSSVPLANKKVNFLLNDKKYSATTNSKGVASLTLRLNPGNYVITAYFEGDDAYKPSNNLACSIKVATTIKAADITKYYKGSKAYKATFLNSQGKALKNTKVTITVKGMKYSKKTNKNGLASLPINLKPGTYKITSANPSTGQKLSTTFKILTTIDAPSIKKVKGDSKKFVVKFYKSNGKALAKKYVKVKIRGKAYWYRTNSKGKLSFSFNNYKTGTYKVICYNNDGLSKKSTVQIYSKATTKLSTGFYTFIPGDSKQIKIRFTTSLDDNSKSGKSIRITIDGNDYYRKTNANGEISFNLPSLRPNVYYFICYYDGNKFFKSSSAGNYVTILDTSETELTLAGDTSFGDFAGTPLHLAYTAGGVALIKRTVSFNINGTGYSATTDSYGIASLPIYLDVGNYTVGYETSDDGKIHGSAGSCNITVFERNTTLITCQFKASYKDISQTFKVHLTDFNGTPMAYEDVLLKIGDDSFYEMTDADGYATFAINIAVGKYTFSVSYAGDNNYKPSSASYTTTVQLSKYASGLNEKNSIASSDYLKASKNCQVSNAKIKSLVNSLTNGMTSALDKARVIFNYVRDNIDYAYYFDSKRGAVKTLTSKSGNCVDQAHLLVAMYRAAGLKARYVHGSCKFYDDGQYCGHVWTQVLIDRTWICGDPIDYGNGLGKITNWNTKNYKVYAKYQSLPF